MPKSPRLGRYITSTTTGERYKAFLPPDLPPDPPIELLPLQNQLVRAGKALGSLNAVSDALPDSGLFLYYYVRKEAVLSSQIEGTQSSLSDLLLYESKEVPSTPLDDVAEVSSYVAALQHGLLRIQDGFPLSLRLIREMHEILLSHGRGHAMNPGEFRQSQNWIGGSRPGNAKFVPPPPEHLMECLDAFEKYMHIEERPYSALIDAGLLHVQFETIHPFLDGNGRIGRLLITFFLMVVGELTQPALYLSLFFKNNRNEYYERLSAVRSEGDWEGWLAFFLDGVAQTAEQVVRTTHDINRLFDDDLTQISKLKRPAIRAKNVHRYLCQRGIVNVKDVAANLGITPPTARSALNDLKKQGIVQDIKGSGRERIYVYTALIEILDIGAEPINYK